MIDTSGSRGTVLAVIVAVVTVSGCVQGSSTNLESGFQTDSTETDFNRSGSEIYTAALEKAGNVSEYSVESENKMAMNLPVFSVSVNMTSKGDFQEENSTINTSGSMTFGAFGRSNSTEFTSSVETSGNSSKISTGVMSETNATERQAYSRERLGVTLEALQEIELRNVTPLGVTGDGETVLKIQPNSTQLMKNSGNIFEVHSPVQESTDGQRMEQAPIFTEINAYLWIGEDSTPEKFAYYGSANKGALQVRSVTDYSS